MRVPSGDHATACILLACLVYVQIKLSLGDTSKLLAGEIGSDGGNDANCADAFDASTGIGAGVVGYQRGMDGRPPTCCICICRNAVLIVAMLDGLLLALISNICIINDSRSA